MQATLDSLSVETRLFGTDGIRGLANRGKMSPELAFRIGAAMAYQAQRNRSSPARIIIGKDTRLSGYMFETALASGVCAMGGRVLLSGPLPTPAIAHITTSMRADAGIVISASHNPFADNGIKIFGPAGYKLPDAHESDLERLVYGHEIDQKRPVGMRVGRAERLEDAWGRYVAFVKSQFPAELKLDGLKIVVDAAHGAAYRAAPAVFSELGASVYPIGVKPNGKNINAKCGAMFPEACAREVLRHGAHLGIALDGDADRVIVIDEQGRSVDGDVLMALCASRLLRANKLKKRTLVATVMSNLGLEHALQRENGKLVRCRVGDRYVVEALRQGGYNFGGEQSGHLVFLDHSTTGDGLVAALQLIAILLREQTPLSQLANDAFDRIPQVLLNASFKRQKALEEMPHTSKRIAQATHALGERGRVLVRWSGTEPKLRVMIEGPDPQRIRRYARDILHAAEKELR
ncbi:MAG: phosphoglucosamine mutase [Myxococcales bacterium]|nr:phosphoglucosamine mutase [Myxococcales bacterium]MCB9708158.1 phosphoglucosamine mutase [Myxococcales bacterium]